MEKKKLKTAKFIKLGRKGAWEDMCITDGTIRLGYPEISHDIASSLDSNLIADEYTKAGKSKIAATTYANQIMSYYKADKNTIWITFTGGFLYWCRADGPIEWLGGSAEDIDRRGARKISTLDGWHNKSLGGTLLYENELSGNLTKVKGYRGTICDIPDLHYLVQKIFDEDISQVAIAKSVRKEALLCLIDLMRMLTPQDFELLVDLVFIGSGWRRMNLIGGVTKDTDMELMLPSTGERAFVQVKSHTDQKQFDLYQDALEQRYEQRMFYVYHTTKTPIENTNPNIHLVNEHALAEMVLNAGLFDWLLKKAG